MSGPVFRDYNWRDLLSRIDADLDKPAPAYQFGNGRAFIDSGDSGGAYIYSHKHIWKFNTGTSQGWDCPDTRIVVGADSLTFVTSRDASRLLINGLDFSGLDDRYIRMRFRRLIQGVWQGRLYYSTASHNFGANYYCDIADPGLASGFVMATWDMHQLTVGGSDWRDNMITGLAFAMVTGPAQTGTAQAGTSTSLMFATGASVVDDTYKAMTLRLNSGAGSVQERTISDYDGTSKVATVSPRWATNHNRYSEQFDNAYWVKTNLTVSPNFMFAPGTSELEADKIIESAVTDFHVIDSSSIPSVPANQISTVSVHAYLPDRQYFTIRLYAVGATGNYCQASFSLITGNTSALNVGAASGAVCGYDVLRDGWYRFWVKGIPYTSDLGGVGYYFFTPAVFGGSASYAGDGVSGFVLWGAQIEPVDGIGEYIETTTVAVTLPNATTVYETGASFEVDWIGIGASSSLNDENLPIT